MKVVGQHSSSLLQGVHAWWWTAEVFWTSFNQPENGARRGFPWRCTRGDRILQSHSHCCSFLLKLKKRFCQGYCTSWRSVPSVQTDSEYIIWHNAGTTHVTENTREGRNVSVFGKSLDVYGCTPTHEILLPWPKKLRQPRACGTGSWSVEHARAYVWLVCLSQFFWPG